MVNNRLFPIATAVLLAAGLLLALALAPPAGNAAAAPQAGIEGTECGGACHQDKVDAWLAGMHSTTDCLACHEGAVEHNADPGNVALYPRVHFDMELCGACHQDQLNTFEIVSRGRTYYGGSDDSALPPKGWSKTSDLPYWNVLIDGHPFVLETYEDSPMADNQIEHQETIRPGSEACLECHGTKVAFAMGIEYTDKNGVVHSSPAAKIQVTLPNGIVVDIPTKEYTLKSDHTIYDGTSHWDGTEWTEDVATTVVPAGTRMWTYTDGVNPSSGPYAQPYQVKTVVTLPTPQTATVSTGTITFDTVASYPDAGADINGTTSSPEIRGVAREWIYSALEALAFDELDYYFDDPQGETHFTGGGMNWPSVVSGELCNQCHDPHSGQMRIVKKSLIAAIAQRGINPYSATGQNVLAFEQATRQDQVIALCAQCHSEYVGGYSANTALDQDYFPWAKPADLETQYHTLFGDLQDWTHGGPVQPWQSTEANARGFLPYGQRYTIGAPLVKVQHPEAEQFMNSTMYTVGATCTDCHSYRIDRPDGTRYTSHWFASPLKLMTGFTGQTETGVSITLPPQNPCVKCHTTDTFAQSQQKIKNAQDNFYVIQERTQVALVNALKFINAQAPGPDRDANVATYRRAATRWEYYSQAENSMGFHNNAEAAAEVANARIWVDALIPWPLTPVNLRATGIGADTLTVVLTDQATDETGFVVERATLLEGPYTQVADIPTPNGANLGDVEWTDTNLSPGTAYYYRAAAYNAAGTSVYSVWEQASTTLVVVSPPANLTATTVSASRIDLSWLDTTADETGFRVERAQDAAFAVNLKVYSAAANATGFSDVQGLLPGTTYYYRVFAETPGGRSGASNTAQASTPDAPPNAPTNLVVKAVGPNYISLAWKDNSNNELAFYVFRSTDGTTWTRVATLAANTTAYTNTGLARRTTYGYRVRAIGSGGPSSFSNVVSAKTR